MVPQTMPMQASGYVDHRFEPVAEAFLEGFDSGRDVGACLAVMVDGELVIDLWHGHTDRKRQTLWRQDTLICMFSVTKAMTTICLLQAIDRGLVDLDAPVARYWPEFAAHGKEAITVRHLLTHQAGLVGFHEPVDREILFDWERYVAALERESTWWEPGTSHGYHARTFGYLAGEVLRRTSGMSLGTWFRHELADPLELDFAIGLAEADLSRCADVLPARIRPGAEAPQRPGASEMMRDFSDPATPTGAAFQNPAMGPGYMNSREFRRTEIPAANGHGTARSVARLFDDLNSLVSADTLAEATTTQSFGPDAVLKSTSHFGLGFMLHHDEAPLGVRPGTFGHAGAGGSMAFHDPESRVSFCFAMNQMELGVVTGGVSAMCTARAVYDCL